MRCGRFVTFPNGAAAWAPAARAIVSILWLSVALWSPAAAYVSGETHRTADQPSAAVRDARHRTALRITVWYPAAEGAVAQQLAIGDPQRPVFEAVPAVGREAPSVLISIQFLMGHRPTIPIPIGRRVFHGRLLGLWCHDAESICGALAQSCSSDFGQSFSCRDFGVQHIRASEDQ
jgi:hypothetical protein